MIYVELWFDVEQDRKWKITLWQIKEIDFDPMDTPYITLETGTENQHAARTIQLSIVRDLKEKTDVVANAYMDRSRFIIQPRWMEELLSPIGRVEHDKTPNEEVKLDILKNIYYGFLEVAGGLKC